MKRMTLISLIIGHIVVKNAQNTPIVYFIIVIILH
nr:MAG TPA: hypothetical protein [Caudoviricetes sp.]